MFTDANGQRVVMELASEESRSSNEVTSSESNEEINQANFEEFIKGLKEATK